MEFRSGFVALRVVRNRQPCRVGFRTFSLAIDTSSYLSLLSDIVWIRLESVPDALL